MFVLPRPTKERIDVSRAPRRAETRLQAREAAMMTRLTTEKMTGRYGLNFRARAYEKKQSRALRWRPAYF